MNPIIKVKHDNVVLNCIFSKIIGKKEMHTRLLFVFQRQNFLRFLKKDVIFAESSQNFEMVLQAWLLVFKVNFSSELFFVHFTR